MKTLEIDVDVLNSQNDVLNILEQSHLEKGDKILIKNYDEKVLVAFLAVVYVMFYFLSKNKIIERENFGSSVLDKIFQSHSIEELKNEIEELGVSVEIENEERDFWLNVGKEDFLKKAWEEDEDFSHLVIKEPNTSYKSK